MVGIPLANPPEDYPTPDQELWDEAYSHCCRMKLRYMDAELGTSELKSFRWWSHQAFKCVRLMNRNMPYSNQPIGEKLT